jgi:hypothetical protein
MSQRSKKLLMSASIFIGLATTTFGQTRAVKCPLPLGIKELVACQNKVIESKAGKAATVSDYMSSLIDHAGTACTRSGASAQPAYPAEGDLRCFLVFKTGATLSVNIVEGINDNHIEISERVPSTATEYEGVLLAHFYMTKPITFAQALQSPSINLNDRGLKCGFCHDTVGNYPIEREGTEAWVLVPIKLNSTVRRTIPRNGQIPPEQLGQVLTELWGEHACAQKRKLSETCRRLEILRSNSNRLPLDNPE